jgi:hypothetical protein
MSSASKRPVLSPALVATILRNWLGEGDEETDQSRVRIQLCENAIETITRQVRLQLQATGHADPLDWLDQRPRVIGYVNALADGTVKNNGETSRWATAYVALPVLLALMGNGWDEDMACTEAQRLWECRDPGYLAGIAAAKADKAALAGLEPFGLTALLKLHAQGRKGPKMTSGFLAANAAGTPPPVVQKRQ